MTTDTGATSSYLLGHAEAEVERLLLQGRLYNGHTEQALRLAGLEPGMRVLDVGCGPGDVSLIAADIVGPTGSVIGVDAEPAILDVARARAAERGLATVSFEQALLPDVPLVEPVDAVIGRLILMHLPDPVAVVRHLATLVRPGGLVVFHDFEISSARSVPEVRLLTRLIDLIVQCFRAAGLSTEFGTTMYSLFQRAGLPAPDMTTSACLGGVEDPDLLAYAVAVWRMMLPIAQRLGIDIDDLGDIDSLLPRLREEAVATEAVVIMPLLISAWSRVPTG